MDGCVREGSWLNLNSPWEMEAGELWPCHENIQPGSYFPGSGVAIFETSGGNTWSFLAFLHDKASEAQIIFPFSFDVI